MGQPSYVGFWARTLAFIIDSILFVIITSFILTSIYGVDYWTTESESFLYGFWDAILNYILPAIVVIIFWFYKSATPGKIIFQQEIVDATTGKKPSKQQFIKRYLGYYVSILALFLGIFWVMVDKRRQGWHDKIANTVVVRRGSTTDLKQKTPIWLIFINVVFVLFIYAAGTLMYLQHIKIAVTPEVIQGSEMRESVVSDLVDIGVLQPNEKIRYFYSPVPFSFTYAGNFFTDNRVVSYQSSNGSHNISSAAFQDISHILFKEADDSTVYSDITIYTHDERSFTIEVTPDDDNDDLFYDKLKAQWKQ